MDGEYARAYEVLRNHTARYEARIRENEVLRKVSQYSFCLPHAIMHLKELGMLEVNHASALDALNLFDDVAKRLRERELKVSSCWSRL